MMKCDICGDIAEFLSDCIFVINGRDIRKKVPLCEKCALKRNNITVTELPKCSTCGGEVTGRYLKIKGRPDDIYCSSDCALIELGLSDISWEDDFEGEEE